MSRPFYYLLINYSTCYKHYTFDQLALSLYLSPSLHLSIIYAVYSVIKIHRLHQKQRKYLQFTSRNGVVSCQLMVGRRQRHQMLGSPAGVTSQKATTPCAACKLRRIRCTQDCPFSPYFSPHEPQQFASVHKVFGASNVSKMLMVRSPKP